MSCTTHPPSVADDETGRLQRSVQVRIGRGQRCFPNHYAAQNGGRCHALTVWQQSVHFGKHSAQSLSASCATKVCLIQDAFSNEAINRKSTNITGNANHHGSAQINRKAINSMEARSRVNGKGLSMLDSCVLVFAIRPFRMGIKPKLVEVRLLKFPDLCALFREFESKLSQPPKYARHPCRKILVRA